MAKLDELVVELKGEIGDLRAALTAASKLTADSADKMQENIETLSKKSSGGFNKMAASWATFAGNLAANAVASAFRSIGNAIVGSIDDIRQFSSAIAEVNSILPRNEKLTRQNRLALIQLSSQYGGTAQQQAKAFYQIVSAGVQGTAQQFQLLGVANKAAVAGVTDVETAIKGLTNALAVFQDQGLTAEQAADTLFVAVREGKTNFELLSNNIGKVAPIAKAAGLGFDELAGAISFITKTGTSTEITITNLKAAITALAAPSADIRKRAEEMGVSLGEASLKSNGLVETFRQIKDATGGSLSEIQKIIPSIEGAAAVAAVASGDFEDFERIMRATKDATGATSDAFKEIEKSADFQLTALTSELMNLPQIIALAAEGPLAELIMQLREGLPAGIVATVRGFSVFVNGIGDIVTGVNALLTPIRVLGRRLSLLTEVSTLALAGEFKLIGAAVREADADVRQMTDRAFSRNTLNRIGSNLKEIANELEENMSGENFKSLNTQVNITNANLDQTKQKITAAAEAGRELANSLMEGMANPAEETSLLNQELENRIINEEQYWERLFEVRNNAFLTQTEQLQAALEAGEITQAQFDEAALQAVRKKNAEEQTLERKKNEALEKQEKASQAQRLAGLATFFGGFAALARAGGKGTFEIGKRLAQAQAAVQGFAAIQGALASPPFWPANAPAVLGLTAQTAANLANIEAQSFNRGIDSVPGIGNRDTVPALLTPGERVVPRETNQDLTAFLDRQGMGGNTINQTFNIGEVNTEDEGSLQNLMDRIRRATEQGLGELP